jgi:hypothetical protein
VEFTLRWYPAAACVRKLTMAAELDRRAQHKVLPSLRPDTLRVTILISIVLKIFYGDLCRENFVECGCYHLPKEREKLYFYFNRSNGR